MRRASRPTRPPTSLPSPPTSPLRARRAALGAGLAAVSAGIGAGLASLGCRSTSTHEQAHELGATQRGSNPMTSSKRHPVVYLPHGGGPWPFVDVGFGSPAEYEALSSYLRSVRSVSAEPPRALLVVSAHWEERVPTVQTSPAPPLLFDYYGFPPASYQLTWPAKGDPELAARTRSLLAAAGFSTAEDATRGFDHGTFVPLKVTYPEAQLPTVQLSLVKGLDPASHLAMGRALAPLRDEGVLIVGSGMSYHNLRRFGPAGRADSLAFDAWLREAVTREPERRDEALTRWTDAPAGRAAHPREEHLLPLHVIAGAAGSDRGEVAFTGTFAGVAISAVHFG